ncbi:MAG: YerC/YecD family TrpR-related protein [Candidatus Roizmanbacteria bacterium]|nr:YerC/YecD family TrpR-related protein [Candidatus Roizmanbacteria bacterium]
MKQQWINKSTDSLFAAVLKLETLDEVRMFFRDLLTEQEIEEFANRWKVAQMLSEKVPYSTIERETGMSSTTIARVNKYLTGKFGGYKHMISKTIQNNNHHTPV